jgi:hypothetical protein
MDIMVDRGIGRRRAALIAGQSVVCAALLVEPRALRAPTRSRRQVAEARQLFAYLARVELGVPARVIARFLGRDSSTVAYACRVVEDRRDDLRFDVAVAALGRAAAELYRLAVMEDEHGCWQQ